MTATTTTARRSWRAVAVAGLLVLSKDVRAQIIVSGSPPQLTVSSAIAGSAPTDVTDASTTYSITAPPSPGHYTLTASINTALPPGVTLSVSLTANQGTSAGTVALSTIAQNVVTSIGKKENNQVITYTLSATLAAGVVPVQTRIVTLTAISTP